MKLAAAALALSLVACAQTKKVVEREPADPSGRYVAAQAAMAKMLENFERVNFEYDSAQITGETQAALADNVVIMREYPEVEVEVEGHCDETGSTEYNLALGQRRADAIRKYLLTAGVQAERVTTVSYGEERPLSGAELAVNRRAEFRVRMDPLGLTMDTVAASAKTTSEPVAALDEDLDLVETIELQFK